MRDRIELHLNEAPKLRSPILIAGFPDSGRVAKIVLDHLVKELKALDVQIIDSRAVTWMNGLIPGLAKIRNLKGLFLSGETSGFMVDPRAAMIILRVLIRKLGLQIEMKELEEQAKEIDDALKKGGDKESSAAQPGKAKYVG